METPVIYKHKEGVWFRKMAKSDLADMMKSKAASWTSTHSFLVPSWKSQEQWFEKIDSSGTDLVLIGLIENATRIQPFGFATFYNIDHYNRSLQIGGHIYPDFRKQNSNALKGWYAGIDFAFEMLNMNRIYGEVLETNTAALKLDEMTMKKEGIKRQACYQSGRYLDSVMFGLLREEWEASDRVKGYGGICNTQVSE